MNGRSSGTRSGDSGFAREPEERPGRLRIAVRGAVQGVGFRPFIYKLATEMNLCGWVANDAGGVHIEVEGPAKDLERFLVRIEPDCVEIPAGAPVPFWPVRVGAYEEDRDA